ncbi:MAG: AAA family ATPase [Kiritimatiellae bacterium]|nr:AAA family ATPase [Kiritimatiellia bacterium]
MADKPLYYGSTKAAGPMYYGGKGPMYYGGGQGPMYYGGGPKYGGAYGAYGSYGSYGSYGGYGGEGEDGSIVGTVTMSRMLRVVSQRWLSVFVFLLVGLIVSFAVYRISPTIYEAKSEFTIDMRRVTRGTSSALDESMPDFGANYAEIFNTRISDWRSEKIVLMIQQQYRTSNPASTVSDDDIVATLVDSKLELQRNSRIITIAVRSKSAQLAAALANAYAESIEAYTDEENKVRCDKAVSQTHENVEKKRRDVDKITKQLLDFRTTHKVDNLRSSRDTISQGLSKTTADILALETQETQLTEWEKLLTEVQKDPETFGSLASGVPRAEEIAKEYRAFQDASGAYQNLLVSYTENHPEVVAKKKELDFARQRFLDASSRALLTGRSTLQVVRNQLANLKQKQSELRNDLASVEQQIVFAESGLGKLEAEYGVAHRLLESLILEENKMRIQSEANNEIVRVARQATVPTKPVLPNPIIIFGIGVVLSLGLGFLFVLVIDNLEDTVVNLSDIEGRLALKVLAVFPHVRRKRREQVARFLIEDKYSQFSEAVAGLRNLLDSPRYEAFTHCLLVISTQPGEGKTITSTSIAISHAQTGKKVLHVDFDLRRPRLAKIWGLELTQDRSFSHVLQSANGGEKPDFAKLVNKSVVPGLDVICSLPPEGVSPATIFGSAAVTDFFEWARANYDRVVVDAPPYGIVGDVVSLAAHVDSVIIMCCPDRTHFRPIQYCSRSLTEAGANILGVVVNDVEVSNVSVFDPTSHRHYGYGYGGYGYGYGYGYRPKKGAEAAKAKDAEGKPAQVGKGEPETGSRRKLVHEELADEE